MKTSFKHDTKASYLDVTEFILKECSPLIKATSPKTNFYQQRYEKTSQINPIDHDPSKFQMTPLCTGFCAPQIFQIMDEFALECGTDGFVSEGKYESRSKHSRTKQLRQRSVNLIQYLEEDQILNMIPQLDNDDDLHIFDVYDEQEMDFDESQQDYSDYSYDIYPSSCKEEQLEKLSTGQDPSLEFNETIQRFRQNPKKQIIKQMRQIESTMPEESEQSKKHMIKKLIEKYLLDYETYCYEEAWKELQPFQLNAMIKKIIQGLNETFSKKIGKLPFQIRRTKILKYLEKKKKRIWKKKVSYDCRKKVADGRLRIKGKFVTRQQACQQLGVQTLEGYTAEEIKYLLQKRLQSKQFEG